MYNGLKKWICIVGIRGLQDSVKMSSDVGLIVEKDPKCTVDSRPTALVGGCMK
jgi:hypothetical protein